MGPAAAAVVAAGVDPLVPTLGEAVLGWGLSLVLAGLWVAGFVSLSRGPLDARGRLPWAGAMLLLPVLGALIWFWWRHHYYPARRREQPGWDPNERGAVVVPPRRGRPVPSGIGRPDPYAGVAAPKGLAPRRRYGAGQD